MNSITVHRGMLQMNICTGCMGDIIEQLEQHTTFVKHNMVLTNLDHIYYKMLQRGKQNMVTIECTHSYKDRYYIPAHFKVSLNEFIDYGVQQYYVNLSARPKQRIRLKLIHRYSHLIDQSDSSEFY